MTCYALLDPAGFSRPLTWLVERGLAAVPLLPLDSAAGIAHVTPWLTQPDAAAAAELSQYPTQDWGLWIETTASLADLANLLADRRMARDIDDRPMMLRWWDIRTLQPLWPALSSEQKAWLLRGLDRIGLPAVGTPIWLQAPVVVPVAQLTLTAPILAALSDWIAADRVAPIKNWIAERWPDLSEAEGQGLATVTVAQARRLGLEDPRDWLCLAQLLALLGSGFLDDPLYAPLVEELFLTADRRRLARNEADLLALANARLTEGSDALAVLRLVFTRDELAARYAVLPDDALVRQVYGAAAGTFAPEAITAARQASTAALQLDHPAADALDRLRFWFIRLLLGADFMNDPLRQAPAEAYGEAGMVGLAAWVNMLQPQLGDA